MRTMDEQMVAGQPEPGDAEQVLEGGCAAMRLQVAAVDGRVDEVSACLRRRVPHGTRGLARLIFEWNLLEAWLERSTSASPSREQGLRLWTSPSLEHLRAKLRRMLQQGAAFSREPVASLALVAHLYLLASKLVVHEATLLRLRDELVNPTCTQAVVTYRVEHGYS